MQRRFRPYDPNGLDDSDTMRAGSACRNSVPDAHPQPDHGFAIAAGLTVILVVCVLENRFEMRCNWADRGVSRRH